jgi:hypothetical protein
MQIGSVVGLALFGVVLANVVAAEMRSGFGPLIAQLPPAMRAQVNLQQLGASRADSSAVMQDVLPPQVRPAARAVVRRAFATGVTRIYAYSAGALAIALFVLLALPETSLRTSSAPPSRAGPPPAA